MVKTHGRVGDTPSFTRYEKLSPIFILLGIGETPFPLLKVVETPIGKNVTPYSV